MNANEEKQLRNILNEFGIELSDDKFEQLANAIAESSYLARKCQVTFKELVAALCICMDGGISSFDQTRIEIIELKNGLRNLCIPKN